jgi:hypothetical protein
VPRSVDLYSLWCQRYWDVSAPVTANYLPGLSRLGDSVCTRLVLVQVMLSQERLVAIREVSIGSLPPMVTRDDLPIIEATEEKLHRHMLGKKVINALLKRVLELAARPETFMIDAAAS